MSKGRCFFKRKRPMQASSSQTAAAGLAAESEPYGQNMKNRLQTRKPHPSATADKRLHPAPARPRYCRRSIPPAGPPQRQMPATPCMELLLQDVRFIARGKDGDGRKNRAVRVVASRSDPQRDRHGRFGGEAYSGAEPLLVLLQRLTDVEPVALWVAGHVFFLPQAGVRDRAAGNMVLVPLIRVSLSLIHI